MHKLNKKKGFTLAEVLVALTIVAIIASLCIPVLKKDNFRSRIETGAKKGCYSLEAALDKAIAQDLKYDKWTVATIFSQKILPQLNIAKNCSGNECFNASGITINSSYMLADGISIGVNGAILYVDANGAEEPNVLGVDVYKFELKRIEDEDDGSITLKIEPDSSNLGAQRESAANLIKNGWKITAW